MAGGKAPRQKGNRGERAIVAFLRSMGISAARVPCSGSAGGAFGADIHVTLPGVASPARIEVKCRADGFREDYKWLASADVVIKKADRQDALMVIRLKDAFAAGGEVLEEEAA